MSPNLLSIAVKVALAAGLSCGVNVQAFPPVVQLSRLDGTNGFRIDGVAAGDYSGRAVSAAGDINGDGIDDLVIGADPADPNGYDSGSSYVMFGNNNGFKVTQALSSLDGTNGFRLDGIAAGDLTGRSVSAAGDVNGDGVDDLIIGAARADPNGNIESGSSYVVFGKNTGFLSILALSSLDGTNGFRLDGEAEYDRSGKTVSAAGDVNGDDIDDLLIGAYGADPNGSYSGSSYVVFGRDTATVGDFTATSLLSSLNGTNGFRIDGIVAGDLSSRGISDIGDVNGDGVDDLLIGADGADPNGASSSGSSYVVFGQKGGFAATLALSSLDGTNGFSFDGIAENDRFGRAVSAAGDINGDGIDDLLIGAFGADPNGNYSGSSYVVFGQNGGFETTLSLPSLNGNNGFRIDGVAMYDFSGREVSSAGDINGDGIDDLLIGAFGADNNGSDSGSSYVVFGDTEFPATLALSSLDGTNGFRIDGVAVDDHSGFAVSSAGDVNGDGFDDLLIGSYLADQNGNANTGSSYVVFGSDVLLLDGFEENYY